MNVPELVDRVLSGTPLIDGHNDLPGGLRLLRGSSVEGLDQPCPELHTDLPRLRTGRVGAQFWSLWVPSSLPEAEAVRDTLQQLDLVYRLIGRYPDDLALARTAAEVRRVFKSGRIAALLGVEGGHSIAGSLPVLRCFARLGVRYLTLTHGDNTSWADSATDTAQVGGLNDVGRAVVRELNRLGMLVDLSHVAATTQHAALDVTTAPVIFSHSSVHAVAAHPRNVADDVLTRLAANGGVLQVTFVPEFLTDEMHEWSTRLGEQRQRLGLVGSVAGFWRPAPAPDQTSEQVQEQTRQAQAAAARQQDPAARADLDRWLAANPKPVVTVDDVVAHLNHAREVVGVRHLGIGGDFDGTRHTPEGLSDVSTYPRLFEALAQHGWSEPDLAALAGENMLRVLAVAEEAATEPMFTEQGADHA